MPFTALLAISAALVFAPTVHASLYLNDSDTMQLQQSIDSLNQQLRIDRSRDTFRSISSSRFEILKKLRSIGYEAIFPENEGEILAYPNVEPVCPSNANPLVADYCECDEGYESYLTMSCRKKIDWDEINASRQQLREIWEREGNRCPEGPIPKVYDELDYICGEGTYSTVTNEPTYESCPANSYENGDYCYCQNGYEWNVAGTQCVASNSAPTTTATSKYQGDADLPPDVENTAWFADEVLQLVEQSIVPSDEIFRPSDAATRGEFIKLLVQSIGGPRFLAAEEPSFDDVPGWYLEFFEKAAASGWLKGEGDCLGRRPCYARPNNPINRAEAAALIIRAFDLLDAGTSPTFLDAPDGQWYTKSIRTAASLCILKGDAGTAGVRPSAQLNRAEMVVMLARVGKRLQYPDCGD